MELQEKIIIALVLGLYLCYLIYQNRDYFKKKPVEEECEEDEEYEEDRIITIETKDESKDYIQIILPDDTQEEVIMRYWIDDEQRFETYTLPYDEFAEKWDDVAKEHDLKPKE